MLSWLTKSVTHKMRPDFYSHTYDKRHLDWNPDAVALSWKLLFISVSLPLPTLWKCPASSAVRFCHFCNPSLKLKANGHDMSSRRDWTR